MTEPITEQIAKIKSIKTLHEIENDYILFVLQKLDFNQAATARALGVSYRKINRRFGFLKSIGRVKQAEDSK